MISRKGPIDEYGFDVVADLTAVEEASDDEEIVALCDLPPEVLTAKLADYEMHQLEARKVFYEREAVFERNNELRAKFHREAARTEIEINRRKLYERAEAERIFEL